MALEPEWEAKFEPNSYGFRPGRSADDAIEQIYKCINRKPKYVLDADIAKCFDRISHKALLNKVGKYHGRKLIKNWLKAGVLDNGAKQETVEGTPQGGVISPLLANIALHGMEEAIKEYALQEPLTKWTMTYSEKKGQHRRRINDQERMDSLALIRYADDFVSDAPRIRGCFWSKESHRAVAKTYRFGTKTRKNPHNPYSKQV
jgi:RNA-directed DNA polymerase